MSKYFKNALQIYNFLTLGIKRFIWNVADLCR